MKIKVIIGILLLFLLIGITFAAYNNEIFTAPSSLHPIGHNDFVDEKGHNINIIENTPDFHQTWFENDTETKYIVKPYSENNSFYLHADDEDCGILEIVEKDGVQYIINSWTPNSGSGDMKIIYNNLLEFNKLNHLTPLSIEG